MNSKPLVLDESFARIRKIVLLGLLFSFWIKFSLNLNEFLSLGIGFLVNEIKFLGVGLVILVN